MMLGVSSSAAFSRHSFASAAAAAAVAEMRHSASVPSSGAALALPLYALVVRASRVAAHLGTGWVEW